MDDYQWIGHNRDRVVADHRKLAHTLGVPIDALSQHAKRGNIPTVAEKPGRGRFHQYHFAHVLHAAIVVELGRYGLRHTERNRKVIAAMVKGTLDNYSGQINPDFIDKKVYFVIEFDADGEMDVQSHADTEITLKGINGSAIVVVVSDIIGALLSRLKDRSTDEPSKEPPTEVADFLSQLNNSGG